MACFGEQGSDDSKLERCKWILRSGLSESQRRCACGYLESGWQPARIGRKGQVHQNLATVGWRVMGDACQERSERTCILFVGGDG